VKIEQFEDDWRPTTMTALVFPLVSRSNAVLGHLYHALAAAFDAIREGRDLAAHYESLARKSDTELFRLGIAREQIPTVVMFGRPR
jgi:hypothetical protein